MLIIFIVIVLIMLLLFLYCSLKVASIYDEEEIMEENNERKNEKINMGMDKVLG